MKTAQMFVNQTSTPIPNDEVNQVRRPAIPISDSEIAPYSITTELENNMLTVDSEMRSAVGTRVIKS